MRLVKKLLNHTETYVILIALLFGVAVEAVSHQFFSNTGMVNLARISMIYLIFGVAEMISLVCAGPDVSYPAIASLSGFQVVNLLYNIVDRIYIGHIAGIGAAALTGVGLFAPILMLLNAFAMLIGAVCGAVNGAIIARFNFPSLIVTLGTSSIFSGLMYGPLRASNTVLHGKMAEFGAGSLFTVTNPGSGLTAQMPTQFLIVIVVYVIMHFVLRYTMFGRGLYAIGSDSVAAERAGLKVGRIRFFAYVLGGALAALGGTMYTCNVGAIAPSDLMGGELLVIAACILGGVRPGSGIGNLFQVIIRIVLLTMIQNNLLMLGIPLYWKDVFTGAIILIGTVVSFHFHVQSRGKARSVKEG